MLIVILIVILILCADPRPIKRYFTIQSDKLSREYKIIQLSDLHSEIPAQVLSWIDEENPDMIMISGDLIDRKRNITKGFALIEKLKKYKNIYYISGNHEYRHKKLCFSDLKKYLSDAGICVLDNQTITIEDLVVTGISDCLQVEEKNEWVEEKKIIDRICADLDESKFNLLMIHRPDHYSQLNEYPIDLMLSGHAHGGQWRIPGILNGIYAPQQGFFPKRSGGLYKLPHGVQIVSRGLARFWWMPRFFNRPEVIIIELKKE